LSRDPFIRRTNPSGFYSVMPGLGPGIHEFACIDSASPIETRIARPSLAMTFLEQR
jgi:hypothetical protein